MGSSIVNALLRKGTRQKIVNRTPGRTSLPMLGFAGSAGVGAGANVLFGLDFKSTFVIRRIKLTEDTK